jgi:CheY-like chemotaxis protein
VRLSELLASRPSLLSLSGVGSAVAMITDVQLGLWVAALAGGIVAISTAVASAIKTVAPAIRDYRSISRDEVQAKLEAERQARQIDALQIKVNAQIIDRLTAEAHHTSELGRSQQEEIDRLRTRVRDLEESVLRSGGIEPSAGRSGPWDHRPAKGGELLLVEDDEMMAQLVVRHLARRGWRVTVAPTIAEAIALVADAPDAILLDLMMPDGSGEDVIKYVRDHGLPIPVVVYTAMTDARDEELLKAGAARVFHKGSGTTFEDILKALVPASERESA